MVVDIDRKKIANEVFGKKEKLQALNRIMHPKILSEIKKEVKETKGKHPKSLIILDAALILELGLKDLFDKLIFALPENISEKKKRILADHSRSISFLTCVTRWLR